MNLIIGGRGYSQVRDAFAERAKIHKLAARKACHPFCDLCCFAVAASPVMGQAESQVGLVKCSAFGL